MSSSAAKSNFYQLLSFGYVRESVAQINLQQIVPLSLYDLIYRFSLVYHMKAVLLGHVDSGKSTLIGHLLQATGNVKKRDMEWIQKHAMEMGKSSFSFAFLSDKTREERQRGVTIHGRSHHFPTDQIDYTIFDAPGHRDFTKNAVRQVNQCDVAVLVIATTPGGFECSIQKGNHRRGDLEGGARRHAQLAYHAGMKQLVVALNKLDAPGSGKYSEEWYQQRKQEALDMLLEIGFSADQLLFVPISAWVGDNVYHKSENMKWYRGFGTAHYTLYDALQYFIQPQPLHLRPENRDVDTGVVSIDCIFNYTRYKHRPLDRATQILCVGLVECGQVKTGDKVLFHPRSGAVGVVESIEMNHQPFANANVGDVVGLKVSGLDKKIHKRDTMLVIPETNSNASNTAAALYRMVSKQIKTFTVLIERCNHPHKVKCAKWRKYYSKIKYSKMWAGGYCPLVCVGTQHAPCAMIAINWSVGTFGRHEPDDSEADETEIKTVNVKNPEYLYKGDQAEIVFAIQPDMHILVSTNKQLPSLSRVTVMDSRQIIMSGTVTAIDYEL